VLSLDLSCLHLGAGRAGSLTTEHVVLGDAQGGSSASRDGEAPGATLHLVARLVIGLGGDGVRPFRQSPGGGPAVLTWGVTTSLSRISVVLRSFKLSLTLKVLRAILARDRLLTSKKEKI
jgi:hypothetical protein